MMEKLHLEREQNTPANIHSFSEDSFPYALSEIFKELIPSLQFLNKTVL